MSEEITLDKEVFKALAGDTRIAVVKALLERRKTQSELAKELHLAAPTIKDHVDILIKAGLVREVDDGHKWKYIELTVKGKGLLQPSDKRILVLLGTSIIGIACAGFLAYQNWVGQMSSFAMQSTPFMAKVAGVTADTMAASPIMEGASIVSTPEAARQGSDMAVQALPILPIPELAVLVLCLVVFGISVGMWIKQTY